MKKLFISFANRSELDAALAAWIENEARRIGYEVYCELTDDTVPPDLHESLQYHIETSDIFLAIWSTHYLRGEHTEYERNLLLTIDPNLKRKVLLGFRIDDVDIPARFRRAPYIDAHRQGLDRAKDRLIRALTRQVDQLSGPPSPEPELKKGSEPKTVGQNDYDPRLLSSADGQAFFPSPRSMTPPFGQVAPNFQEFLQEVSRITANDIEHDFSGELSTLPVREPKFMVFEKDRSYVMAILDINAKVRPSNLRKTNEAESIGRLVSREVLATLGFNTPFVHPMFRDPHDMLKTIFIDGALFFQAIYFPRSRILLPHLEEGGEKKIAVPIAAFMAAMRRFHKVEKIAFASITRNGWPDRILVEGLQKVHALVRFAPTPTNTLHLGNVRTALVSYLMHRAKWKRSRFFLRIDDTNKATHPDDWTNQIRGDLKWLGFLLNPEWEFSQTDPRRHHIYQAFLSLLDRFGYLRQLPSGEWWLDWERPELQFVYWLDWSDGPIIEHGIPKIVPKKTKKSKRPAIAPGDPTGRGIANLALTTPTNEFLYKFCGAIDEVLCTSHAVRDIRQIHLTRRQSLIIHAIALAWREAVRTGELEEERQLILAERERLVGVHLPDGLMGVPRPLLPFLSPPVFIHTPVVVDHAGEPLKKREPRHKRYSILEGRETGTFLPETIISYLVYTILTGTEEERHDNLRKELGILAAELGVEAFLDNIAIKFAPGWLDRRNDQIKVPLAALEMQERHVVSRISYFHLRHHIRSFFQSNFNIDPPEDLIERVYANRRFFDRWTQIINVIRPSRTNKLLDPRVADVLLSVARAIGAHKATTIPKAFNAELARRLSASASVPDVCRQARQCLVGEETGAPIPVLINVLGLDETEKRLRR